MWDLWFQSQIVCCKIQLPCLLLIRYEPYSYQEGSLLTPLVRSYKSWSPLNLKLFRRTWKSVMFRITNSYDSIHQYFATVNYIHEFHIQNKLFFLLLTNTTKKKVCTIWQWFLHLFHTYRGSGEGGLSLPLKFWRYWKLNSFLKFFSSFVTQIDK